MPAPKILVVEDESIIALDIRQRLIHSGYQVSGIADCTEAALEKIAQSIPDLVLMDIRLRGDTNGIETAAQLLQQYDVPIVFLTAHADQATLEQVKAIQPFGYVVKPFETHDLITAIEVALSRHKAEMAIKNTLEHERTLNNLKSHFVAIVSHEFRNPLSSILFSLDLLERQAGQLSPEKAQSYFQRARDSVTRMNTLLEEVLVMSEAGVGKLKCHRAALDLPQFCRDLIEELRITTKQKHAIHFVMQGVDDQDLSYQLDEKLLRHILTNLLSNAVKYSPEGGKVSLTLIAEPEAVTFSIQDEGIGIALEDQAYLFTCFYRGNNVGAIPGTGLGLSLVKQCVEAHDGHIVATSVLGKGSTFTVRLPCHRNKWQVFDQVVPKS